MGASEPLQVRRQYLENDGGGDRLALGDGVVSRLWWWREVMKGKKDWNWKVGRGCVLAG
jgi:hypothetical protein